MDSIPCACLTRRYREKILAMPFTLRMLLLWRSSAVAVWLLIDFGRQFSKLADC